MKKITTLLLAVAFMAISANASVTINVRTTTGDTPYLYAWETEGSILTSAWPGTKMTTKRTIGGQEFYYKTFAKYNHFSGVHP